MNIPKELHYTKSHEWLLAEGDEASVGITDFAQDALGDVVYVELPEEGDEVRAGERFGDVESIKVVAELLSPVSGVVTAVNEALLDAPELVNTDPYGAWMIKVGQISGYDALLDAESYTALCADES